MKMRPNADIACSKLPVPTMIVDLARRAFQVYGKRRRIAQPQKLVFGQVWQTKSDELPLSETRKVVIVDSCTNLLTDDPIVRVAPVYEPIFNGSYRIEDVASELDLVLPADSHPLRDAMIEVWNSQPMLRRNLFHYFGELSFTDKKELEKLVKLRWGAKDNTHEGATIRPGAAEEEERDLFQMEEWRAAKYLSSEVMTLLT